MSDTQNIGRAVIEAFGGQTKLSRALGDAPIGTVDSWGRNGRIPRWWRRPIIEAAKEGAIDLPASFLEQGDAPAEAPQ